MVNARTYGLTNACVQGFQHSEQLCKGLRQRLALVQLAGNALVQRLVAHSLPSKAQLVEHVPYLCGVSIGCFRQRMALILVSPGYAGASSIANPQGTWVCSGKRGQTLSSSTGKGGQKLSSSTGKRGQKLSSSTGKRGQKLSSSTGKRGTKAVFKHRKVPCHCRQSLLAMRTISFLFIKSLSCSRCGRPHARASISRSSSRRMSAVRHRKLSLASALSVYM